MIQREKNNHIYKESEVEFELKGKKREDRSNCGQSRNGCFSKAGIAEFADWSKSRNDHSTSEREKQICD